MKIRLLIILFMLFTCSEIFAGIRVYMLPQAEINGDTIYVSDICKIEGRGSGELLGIEVPPMLYRDGIIDQDELSRLLAASSFDGISIFGNGTMIIINKDLPEENAVSSGPAVKKGDSVQVEMIKGNITIVLQGRSLDNGSIDEEINVKLKNGRRVRCVITGEKQVRMII